MSLFWECPKCGSRNVSASAIMTLALNLGTGLVEQPSAEELNCDAELSTSGPAWCGDCCWVGMYHDLVVKVEPLLTDVSPSVNEEWEPEPDSYYVCERPGCRRAATWRLRDMAPWPDEDEREDERWLCDKHVPRG